MGVVVTDGDIEFLDNDTEFLDNDTEFLDNDTEFLDSAATRADQGDIPEAAATASTSPIRWLVLVAVLVGGGWLITSTGPDSAEDQPTSTTPVEQSPPTDDEAVASSLGNPLLDGPTIVAPVFDAWPSPRERDPSVVLTPGPEQLPDELVASSFRSTTIAYVNTAGRPTVVSFESGEVSEVIVAATRTHETFAVLAGEVVPPDGAGSEDAIVFHTYRDVDRPGVGTMSDQRGVGLGPELCLSGETCARPDLGLERVRKGGVVAVRFNPDRHPLLSEILEDWEPMDGSLGSTSGYRIPEPVGLIWVIAPTSGGSVSSSGLL